MLKSGTASGEEVQASYWRRRRRAKETLISALYAMEYFAVLDLKLSFSCLTTQSRCSLTLENIACLCALNSYYFVLFITEILTL